MIAMRWLLLVALVGCYKDPHVSDCEIACTGSCPSGLQCVAGACREPGMTGACAVMPGGDAATDAAPDSDGDGIPDARDNCPMKSNADQANEDSDALGDACDPCPIFASSDPAADGDSDGVGDQCDPNPNTGGDTLVLFEPFNTTTTPANATEFGSGGWTYGGGQAHLIAPSGSDSKLVWAQNPAHGTVITRVSLQTSSNPAYAGATQTANGVVGVGCVDAIDATGRTLKLTDGSSSMAAATSSFSPGTAYVIVQRRTGTSNWQCTRDDGPSVSGQLNTGAANAGIYASNGTAIFDYVYIVKSP